LSGRTLNLIGQGVLQVVGRAGTRWIGLLAVAALGLAGCASLDGKADVGPQGKVVSGRDLSAKLRAAVAKKPTTAAHLAGSTIGSGADGVLRLDRNDFAMSFQLDPATSGGSAMKMLIVPQGYFVSAGTKVDGKEWVKLVGDRIDPISSMLGGQVQAVETNVDLENVQRNLLVAKEVLQVGDETVGGVKAAHYRMPMDNAAIKTQIPPSLPAEDAQNLMEKTTGTIDLYLDPEGLPVKVVNTVKNPGGTGTSTVTYEKWGQPVTLPQPTDGDTLDLADQHDVAALDKFLAKVTGQEPNTSPSVPAVQP
jgi:hypothetical protein